MSADFERLLNGAMDSTTSETTSEVDVDKSTTSDNDNMEGHLHQATEIPSETTSFPVEITPVV